MTKDKCEKLETAAEDAFEPWSQQEIDSLNYEEHSSWRSSLQGLTCCARISTDRGNLSDDEEFFRPLPICGARNMIIVKNFMQGSKNLKEEQISIGRSARKAEDKWDDCIHEQTRVRMRL